MRPSASTQAQLTSQAGLLAAVAAYTLWGLLPVFWKQLAHVPAFEVMLHRMVWCLLVLLPWLLWRGRQQLAPLRSKRLLAGLLISGSLIGFNWLLFIWAVAESRVVEVALGYYINPLVNVALGVVFFDERLKPAQWLAVGLAAGGVGWLTWQHGELPWISLGLAGSFGLYAVARKRLNVSPAAGLAAETGLLTPLCVLGFGWLVWQQQNVFGAAATSMATHGWLIAAGPATAAPLLLFAYAARRVSLSLLGILQYLGPSLTLWLGVVIYGEPFGRDRIIAFTLIWLALAVYLGSSWLSHRRQRALARTPPV